MLIFYFRPQKREYHYKNSLEKSVKSERNTLRYKNDTLLTKNLGCVIVAYVDAAESEEYLQLFI